MTRDRSAVSRDTTVRVVDLRSQLDPGVLVAGREPVRLTWRSESQDVRLRQLAYEIEYSADLSSWSSSGALTGDEQVAIAAPGGPLRSREVKHFRVRIETARGWSGWSPTLRVEAGLLTAADWTARPITLPGDPGAERQAPAPLLRRAFELDAPVRSARLHLTALGVHAVTINGRPVSADILAPGWTPYHRRLLADAYDVTGLLRPGLNVIGAKIGDGWFRGRLGWDPDGDRGHYGSQIGLIAQLEVELVDGRAVTIDTDETWQAATGSVRSADLYDGSVVDLRADLPGWDGPGFDAAGWIPVRVLALDPWVIEPRSAPPVRPIAVLPMSALPSDRGRRRLDAGQNVTGWVRLVVRGRRGTTVVVRHAEVLEADGSLHTRSLRTAKATDTYILADAQTVTIEPAFTFHGFRYAEVETDAEVVAADAVAISSDLHRRGSFSCSDAALERLHENVVWSQRDNFVSVPTDCPQRDERLGWTGDAQAFAPTASTLFDAQSFWRSWLRDLALEQHDTLGVSSVVPDVVIDGVMRYGRGGWADAATIVPWAVYEAFGDASVLHQQLPSMRRWVDSLEARRDATGLLPTSSQFGDWLDPDAPGDRPWMAKTDGMFLANAFFAHSARLVASALDLISPGPDATRYRTLAGDVAARTWERWRETATTTQTGCAVALELGIAPASAREATAAALARLVREADGRVSTGFLGTPLVLPALAASGYHDECYLMLLREAAPSWLYPVGQGATTIWERWDAILPDGSIHPGTMAPNPIDPDAGEGHMLSFNHYAYGAVVDWMYRHLAGIAPDRRRPGYRHIRFSPRPPESITSAAAAIETPYGSASIRWTIRGDELSTELLVPFGAAATLDLPLTPASTLIVDGVDVPTEAPVKLAPGVHHAIATAPRLARGRRDEAPISAVAPMSFDPISSQ